LSLGDRSGPTAACSAATCRSPLLSRGFKPLYGAYDVLLADLSPGDQDSLSRGAATAWFSLDRLGLAEGYDSARMSGRPPRAAAPEAGARRCS
jgi:hypothetical protein